VCNCERECVVEGECVTMRGVCNCEGVVCESVSP